MGRSDRPHAGASARRIEEVRQAALHPWRLLHSPESLLAMGVTGNGDYLFWVTQPADAPDE
ncbi:hypothetical protein ACFWF9_08360 [Streptomyces roseolus]|uniref:hypothetical protein n=1 Tax=Streptomyces TaxID=1883 RepID=UPI003657C2CD